jgi:DNA-binding MarR family transcriptional regulator
MPKLNDTQLVILSAASQRADGAVLPLSPTLKVKPSTARRVLNRLLETGLIAEQPAAPAAEVWRQAKDGKRSMLVLADAGRQAIGVEAEPEAAKANGSRKKRRATAKKATKAAARSKATTTEPRRETKQGLLINLLSRPGGASLAEAVEATGWQPHSVRGAISGALKKKLGLDVTSEAVEGRGRVYRIADAA